MTERTFFPSQLSPVHGSPRRWLRIAGLAVAALTLCSTVIPVWAQDLPAQITPDVSSWDGQLHTARLINRDQEITAMVVQLEIFDKPETTYANAIYQLYAQINGRWVAVYTNTGARLLDAGVGHTTLPPEVILLSDMQRLITQDVDLSQINLRAVVTLRYDRRDGQSNQQVEWQDSQPFEAIAITTSPDLLGSSSR